MLRTEEEARKCWCPFARIAVTDGQTGATHVVNRGLADPGCIASECMAWRWQMVETEASKQRHHGIGTYPPPSPVYEQTERGYCGLASGFIA